MVSCGQNGRNTYDLAFHWAKVGRLAIERLIVLLDKGKTLKILFEIGALYSFCLGYVRRSVDKDLCFRKHLTTIFDFWDQHVLYMAKPASLDSKSSKYCTYKYPFRPNNLLGIVRPDLHQKHHFQVLFVTLDSPKNGRTCRKVWMSISNSDIGILVVHLAHLGHSHPRHAPRSVSKFQKISQSLFQEPYHKFSMSKCNLTFDLRVNFEDCHISRGASFRSHFVSELHLLSTHAFKLYTRIPNT